MVTLTRQLSQYANVVSFVTSNSNLLLANSIVFSDGTTQSTSAKIKSTTITDGSSITPNVSTTDQYNVTALTQTLTINIPTGSPYNGQKLLIRIKDNGTSRTLSWNTSAGGYRVVGTVLPSVTIANKLIYVGAIYNSTETYWDVVSVGIQS